MECPFLKKFPSYLKRDDEFFMSMAYNQALLAWENDETPVGAVAVLNNEIIASAYNSVVLLNDPTAHAEMLIISQAASVIGDWRLNNVTIYVTKEPCPMCSGAMIMSRVGEVVYAVSDEKMGCLGGSFALPNLPRMNHRPIVRNGVMKDDCEILLKTFFQMKRSDKKEIL